MKDRQEDLFDVTRQRCASVRAHWSEAERRRRRRIAYFRQQRLAALVLSRPGSDVGRLLMWN